ncbi:class I SAM-dependent methyltransferase [Alkalinema pantanalense CENA528]|uniref:class I SAM-dependent methyltransferase n=1 Tax=Alkalinema pantanalense TaxID=1620705 RepID=UPI003D6F255B
MGEPVDLDLTWERHIPAYEGQGLLLARVNVDHMLRYALVAPFVPGQRVLDISCGAGYGSQYLAIQGAREVVGADNSEESIQFAAQYYPHPNVAYQVADAHALTTFEEASFDVIVSFETIEHLARPRIFLAELRRLLKPDGKLFLSCPNDYRIAPANWVSPYHLHRFRFEEFRNLFLSVFGEGVFLGQHFMVASCLVKPQAPAAATTHQAAYLAPLSPPLVQRQYLEDIAAIENADGYFAVYGVAESEIEAPMAFSCNAYQFFGDYITQEQAAHQALQQEAATLQQQLATNHAQGNSQQNDLVQEVTALRLRIEAMETSKFWKLRQLWISLKRLLGSNAE